MSRTAIKKKAPVARASRSVVKKPLADERVFERVARGERVVIRRGKKALAAIVSLEDLRALEEMEDRLDVEAIEEALAEPGPSIPYEEVRRKLGLS